LDGATVAVFLYLLRHRTITGPSDVWAMDITYIPMERGFVHHAAVLDWASRRVPSWRVSITLDSSLCIAAVEDPIAPYGCQTIMNRSGAQFTSAAFTGMLIDHGIRISMDGNGCWRDNIFVERLRRSLKYEEAISTATTWCPPPPPASGGTSRCTTRGAHIRASPIEPRTKHTLLRCHSP
jgi:transposase InsO family protein